MTYKPQDNDSINFSKEGYYSSQENDAINFNDSKITTEIIADISSLDSNKSSILGKRIRLAEVDSLDNDISSISGERIRVAEVDSLDSDLSSIEGRILYEIYKNYAEVVLVEENNGDFVLVTENLEKVEFIENEALVIK
jgi:hypothetical protein